MSEDNESRRHLAKAFYKRFEAIPDEQWTVGTRMDYRTGARCALGHVSEPYAENSHCDGVRQLQSLFRWSEKIRDGYHGDIRYCVASINNGECPDYQQPTPKARILAALTDVIRQ